jgi:type I site-specific restriction endonuclease
MTQLLLNITDKKKAIKLIEFLKTLNYINIQEFSEENIMIPEAEKELMRNRLENAKEEDFKDWDEMKKKFNIK